MRRVDLLLEALLSASLIGCAGADARASQQNNQLTLSPSASATPFNCPELIDQLSIKKVQPGEPQPYALLDISDPRGLIALILSNGENDYNSGRMEVVPNPAVLRDGKFPMYYGKTEFSSKDQHLVFRVRITLNKDSSGAFDIQPSLSIPDQNISESPTNLAIHQGLDTEKIVAITSTWQNSHLTGSNIFQGCRV